MQKIITKKYQEEVSVCDFCRKHEPIKLDHMLDTVISWDEDMDAHKICLLKAAKKTL